jgi:alpha-tubulin suppressor-like RCC1 family protein
VTDDVKQVACGYDHTVIIKNDGSLWTCGDNNQGQLGLNSTTNRDTFTKVTKNINNDVKQVVCGGLHTFILKTNGTVWGCGYNNYGQLGLGATSTSYNTFTQATTNINNDVKQIVCGEHHTVILKNDGSIWSCGRNDTGQLGLGSKTDSNKFTKVTANVSNDVKQIACGGLHTFIIKNDGSIWACGYNYHGQLGLDNSYETGGFTAYTNFTDILRGL